MTIFNDTCDTCGRFLDPVATDGVLGLDGEKLFCDTDCEDDFAEEAFGEEPLGCDICGAIMGEVHEPGCLLYEEEL